MRLLLVSLLLCAPAFGSWDEVLRKHVTEKKGVGTVDYKGLKAAPQALNAYVKEIEAVTKAQYDQWPADDKLAFLINAYNAMTLKLVVDHYPVKSIKDIGWLLSPVWNKKFFKLLGAPESLGGLEHERIRKEFDEPRIHFAINCASKGCPALRPEPYQGKKLDLQLNSAASAFLGDSTRNRYDAKANRFEVSKIFEWFAEDFTKKHGSVQAFLAPYYLQSPPLVEKAKKASITTLEYDWTLNEG